MELRVILCEGYEPAEIAIQELALKCALNLYIPKTKDKTFGTKYIIQLKLDITRRNASYLL